MLIIRLGYYMFILNMLIISIIIYLIQYCTHTLRESREIGERENRRPQVNKYLLGKKQPYLSRPTIATQNCANSAEILYEREECIICFEEFKTIESEVVILDCGHMIAQNPNTKDVKGLSEEPRSISVNQVAPFEPVKIEKVKKEEEKDKDKVEDEENK